MPNSRFSWSCIQIELNSPKSLTARIDADSADQYYENEVGDRKRIAINTTIKIFAELLEVELD